MKPDSRNLPIHKSPLFYTGVALILAALVSGYSFLLLAGIGLAALGADFILRFLINRLWLILSIQALLIGSIAYGLYKKSAPTDFNVEVTVPEGFAGKYLILFGLPAYPEIKEGQAILPENGVLRTSTTLGYDAVISSIRFKGTKQQVKIDGMGAGACGQVGYVSGTVSTGDSALQLQSAAKMVWDSLMANCKR